MAKFKIDLDKVVQFCADAPRAGTVFIALGLQRSHENIVRTIDLNKADFEEYGHLEIQKNRSQKPDFPDLKSEKSKKKMGRPIKEYLLNREQTTLLITYLRNLKKNDEVKEFKKRLVRRFFVMEEALKKIAKQKRDPEYLQARAEGKIPRRLETDVFQKELVPYAVKQGSKGYAKNPANCYINYSTMTNKSLFIVAKGIKKIREHLDKKQLRHVAVAEDIIADSVIEKMAIEMHYKDIYKNTKVKVEAFADLVGKTNVPLIQIETPKQIALF